MTASWVYFKKNYRIFTSARDDKIGNELKVCRSG